MNTAKLRQLGWKPFFQQQLPHDVGEALRVVRVSAHYGSRVALMDSIGETSVETQLVESAGPVTVGDWLLIESQNHRTVQRLERETLLCRKASGNEVRPQAIAANIDTVFIVCSCNEDFNLSRVERYLALALEVGAQPIVVLTKSDLADNVTDLRRDAERLRAGLVVEAMDARSAEDATVLDTWLRPGKTIALLGSSGVGKSTLATTLGAGELATGSIREKDGKGRHTTTSRSLHQLPSGAVLIDNPGMRELQLPGCEDGVAEVFDDILSLAEECRFNNCRHDGDAGCALLAAVEQGSLDRRRFNSFMKLNAEQAHNARSLAERRERDRKTGRFYKSVMAAKNRKRNVS